MRIDPEPCNCGDRSCPSCYPKGRYRTREWEPEDDDEFGRYVRPEDLPLNSEV